MMVAQLTGQLGAGIFLGTIVLFPLAPLSLPVSVSLLVASHIIRPAGPRWPEPRREDP